jgi:hypothetical protein
MSVTGQAGNPESVLSAFLGASLPQRGVVAEAWARQAETAPWSGIETDPDWRRQLGSAIEIRIGLDVAEVLGYWHVLSFLSPDECRALLSAVGYSADGRENLADTGTTDPLLLDWRRVSHPKLAYGFGKANLVIGRCLIDVKAVLNPAASFGRWLDQLLCHALLDWPDIFGLDSVALYLGWQGAAGPRTACRSASCLNPRPNTGNCGPPRRVLVPDPGRDQRLPRRPPAQPLPATYRHVGRT